ncbi:MAG: three-Cys-motif partner protein TcmP, partial [Candidatus Kuenenia stuttgartiensis]|nr:three-Cys-motif partner protein TcmP [Candidatus Kuenenia stuttgartiensis]
MPIPTEYVGREQTFAKHIFFETYLETLGYHILSFKDTFVYVDGFSGPWESKNDSYTDTSFAIALKKLAEVKQSAEKAFKRPKKVRCLFIEKSPKVFAELKAYADKNTPEGIEVQLFNGDFENLISEIQTFIGKSFSFIFIDPTGWTGYAYEKIKPLFQQKGELLINFMYNYINRFIEDERDNIKASFDSLFGEGGWEDELGASFASGDFMTSERTIVELYCKRLRNISDTPKWAVTYTPISHPVKGR